MDRSLLGLANANGVEAVFGRDDAGALVFTDAVHQMLYFASIAVQPIHLDGARLFAGFKNLQGFFPTRDVIIDRGLLKDGIVSHVKSKARGHGPATLG